MSDVALSSEAGAPIAFRDGLLVAEPKPLIFVSDTRNWPTSVGTDMLRLIDELQLYSPEAFFVGRVQFKALSTGVPSMPGNVTKFLHPSPAGKHFQWPKIVRDSINFGNEYVAVDQSSVYHSDAYFAIDWAIDQYKPLAIQRWPGQQIQMVLWTERQREKAIICNGESCTPQDPPGLDYNGMRSSLQSNNVQLHAVVTFPRQDAGTVNVVSSRPATNSGVFPGALTPDPPGPVPEMETDDTVDRIQLISYMPPDDPQVSGTLYTYTYWYHIRHAHAIEWRLENSNGTRAIGLGPNGQTYWYDAPAGKIRYSPSGGSIRLYEEWVTVEKTVRDQYANLAHDTGGWVWDSTQAWQKPLALLLAGYTFTSITP